MKRKFDFQCLRSQTSATHPLRKVESDPEAASDPQSFLAWKKFRLTRNHEQPRLQRIRTITAITHEYNNRPLKTLQTSDVLKVTSTIRMQLRFEFVVFGEAKNRWKLAHQHVRFYT